MDISWEPIHKEAISHLQSLIRLNTVNPPGNERIAIDYIADILKKEGIEFETFEKEEGRTNLIARLPGTSSDGALLLSSHVDVVPVEEDKWKYPPFEARIEDGYVWGRGAVDMKHMVVFNLMTFLLIKRLGIKLNRDLIWAALADEEAGCGKGSKFLVEEHPDRLHAEYALNEMGGFSLYSGKKCFYPIQVAEKGFVWIKIKARGEPGHGSLPHGDNAIATLARAIERLHKKFLPRHKHPVSEKFILSLAGGLGFPASLVLKGVTKSFGDRLLRILPNREVARFLISTLHNTACPTVLESGQKINVIPSEATLLVDGRILPGQKPESFVREVKELIGPEYDIEVLSSHEATECTADTPLFHIIKEVVEDKDPGSEAIPYLVRSIKSSVSRPMVFHRSNFLRT
jgi:acetylornithine deacetylase/succinyl-diaminopimelate desuccinylase-like protein